MGYYFENEPQNIHNTIKNLFIYYSHSDPMGRTDKWTNGQMDKQTNGQTEKQTEGRTNIYSLFRDKLLLLEGSSDKGRKRFFLSHSIWSESV